jgi:hypothetical protein
MAACRLKFLPATPFAGRGMLGRPLGWAAAARRNTLFSANRITKVSNKAYDVYLLTLQFF